MLRTIRAPRVLSEEELKEIADEMADLVIEKDELQEQKSAWTKAKNEEIKSVEARMSNLAEKYERGEVMEPYDCELKLDPENRERIWVTGEDQTVILREPAEPGDFQTSLEDEIVEDDDDEIDEDVPVVEMTGIVVNGVEEPPFQLRSEHQKVLRDAFAVTEEDGILSYRGKNKRLHEAANHLIYLEYLDADDATLIRGLTEKGVDLFEAGYLDS